MGLYIIDLLFVMSSSIIPPKHHNMNSFNPIQFYMIDPRDYIHTSLSLVLRYKYLCTQLLQLYNNETSNTAWANKTLDDVERMLNTIDTLIVAIESNNDTSKRIQSIDIIGFCTLTGNIESRLLEDIIVRQSYRHHGIGKQLMRYAINHTYNNSLHTNNIELYCNHLLHTFYVQYGFQLIRSNSDNTRCLYRLDRPIDWINTGDLSTTILYNESLLLRDQHIAQRKLARQQQQHTANQKQITNNA